MRRLTRSCSRITAAVSLGVLGAHALAQPPAPVQATSQDVHHEGAPITVARAHRYDITSRINGESYRLLVSTPFMVDPAVAYPVLYVLDGNAWLGTIHDALSTQSRRRLSAPAILVAIGYPSDDPAEWDNAGTMICPSRKTVPPMLRVVPGARICFC